jgi:hypothetical protein
MSSICLFKNSPFQIGVRFVISDRSNGSLGGYLGGVELKKALLRFESAFQKL